MRSVTIQEARSSRSRDISADTQTRKSCLVDVWYFAKMTAIKSYGILMSFCCILTTISASSDVFDGVLGNTVSCHKTCQMTYSLHTYPRVSARHTCLLTQTRFWDFKAFVSLPREYSECCLWSLINSREKSGCGRLCLFTWPVCLRQEEALYACQRGCRLFSICQFVGDSKDLNETRSECESGRIKVLNTVRLFCKQSCVCLTLR